MLIRDWGFPGRQLGLGGFPGPFCFGSSTQSREFVVPPRFRDRRLGSPNSLHTVRARVIAEFGIKLRGRVCRTWARTGSRRWHGQTILSLQENGRARGADFLLSSIQNC